MNQVVPVLAPMVRGPQTNLIYLPQGEKKKKLEGRDSMRNPPAKSLFFPHIKSDLTKITRMFR